MASVVAGVGVIVTERTEASHSAVATRIVTDAGEWNRLILAAPFPHLPQDHAYGEGKAATGWRAVRVVFERGGAVVAMVTILQLHRFGLTLVNRVNRGPIFLAAEPDDETILAVYRALRRGWGRVWTAPLSIATALLDSDRSSALLRRAGYILRHRHSWQSGRIDLTRDEAELKAGLSSGFRNRLRNAQKSGAELRISDDADTYEWMIARHLENMSDKGFFSVGPELLRRLRETSASGVTIFQMLHEGGPVAGMSVVRFGHVAEYHVGWFGPDGRRLNAGNFLMWNIMLEMARRGVHELDVGGMREGDGYTRFKRTMKPEEYRLGGEWISF